MILTMKLLNQGNSKTVKGEKFGFRTFGLHLSPADKSGFNVCKWASKGCKAACLDTAGRGAMSNVQKARVNKTRFFFNDREVFMKQLHKEISSAIKSASRKGMKACFRLNLTSDLPWENIKYKGKSLMEHFPNVPFYDYTKIPSRMEASLSSNESPKSWGGAITKAAKGGNRWPKNYHLTFSRSECNDQIVNQMIARGGNVAVVFRNQLPKVWNGRKVINGDETDLRFLDEKKVIVGLVEKGLAKKDSSGFVVEG